MSPVTLKDVASACGVSTATVSAVVNGAVWVSADTRARVQQAVDAMSYRPNRLARGLKLRQGDAIGVIVSDLANPFFTQVARCLSDALRGDGRDVFLCDADHRFDVGERSFRMLLDRQVEGIVLIGDTVPEETLRHHRRRLRHVPVVAIERDYQVDGVSCLLVDSEEGGYVATRHLLDQGFRRVAFIGGPHEGAGSTTYGRLGRLEGYHRALREADRPADPALIVEGNFRHAGGCAAMLRLLALQEPPDAVFAANDLTALGALHAAQQAGRRVPDDVALVGYDDSPVARLGHIGLTTVGQGTPLLTDHALTVLIERLEGRTGRLEVVEPPQLVLRTTTAPPA